MTGLAHEVDGNQVERHPARTARDQVVSLDPVNRTPRIVGRVDAHRRLPHVDDLDALGQLPLGAITQR
jgi:hypothetical protein